MRVTRSARGGFVACLSVGLLALPAPGQDVAGAGEWWAGIDTLPPGLTVLTVDSVYVVHGATAEELTADLDRKGPRRAGERFRGYHRMWFRYHHRFDVDDSGRCRPSYMRVLARNVLTLPEAGSTGGWPSRLRLDWRTYTTRLRRHEEGHRDLATAELHVFLSEAERVSAADCDAVRERLRTLVGEVEERLRAKQAEYDEDTRHGATQGATWPPRRGGRPENGRDQRENRREGGGR